jgi:hypothetical protein
MQSADDDLAVLGPPPRRARLRRRFRAVRWVLALAAVLPGSCVYALGRVEVAQLERLSREGEVADARVTGKREGGGRDRTCRVTAAFHVNGSTFEAEHTVSRERFAATAIGAPLEVTYLPGDPATSRLDRVDADRVARESAAFTWGALALCAAFGFVCCVHELCVRRALRLLRHGTAAIATVVAPARRARARTAHFVFRTDDGAEHAGRSTFAHEDVPVLPGDSAPVLYDPRVPRRAALLASLVRVATVEPAAPGDRR